MTTSRTRSWSVLLWLLLLLLSGCTAVSATSKETAQQEQPSIAEQERPDGAVSPPPPTSATGKETADQEPLLAHSLGEGAVSPPPPTSATFQSTADQEPLLAHSLGEGAVSPQPPTSATFQSTADQEPLLAHSLGDGAVSPLPRAFDTQPLGLGAPGVLQFGRKNSIVGESSNYQNLSARNSSQGSEVPEAPADVRDVSTVQYLLTAINAPCCPDPTVEEAIEAAKMLPGVLEAEAIEGGIQVTYQPDVVESGAIASTINMVSFMVETVPQARVTQSRRRFQ